MKRIVLTGGGSAGHVTPNLALMELMPENEWEIHYIGSYDGIERSLIEPIERVTYHGISSGKLRRYMDPKNLTDPFRIIKGVYQSRALISKLRPQVVFSKGGFVAVPVIFGARMAGVPIVAHESDLTPGLANRLALPRAQRVCCTFPETMEHLNDPRKCVLTGTPLRDTLFSGSRERGLSFLGFDGRKPILLSMGGSLGAQAINQALRSILPKLIQRFDVAHLCGRGNLDEALKGTPGYCQMGYCNQEMADLFAAADLVVSRAGSNSIHELLALQIPHLLIPLPRSASRGDQIDNVASFQKRGLSAALMQEDMTDESLMKAILETYANRARYIEAMRAQDARQGARRVLEVIEGVILQAKSEGDGR